MVRYPAEWEFSKLQISWNLGIIHLAASNETWLARDKQNVSEKLEHNVLHHGQIRRNVSGFAKYVFASVRKVSMLFLRQWKKRKLVCLLCVDSNYSVSCSRRSGDVKGKIFVKYFFLTEACSPYIFVPKSPIADDCNAKHQSLHGIIA